MLLLYYVPYSDTIHLYKIMETSVENGIQSMSIINIYKFIKLYNNNNNGKNCIEDTFKIVITLLKLLLRD